MKIPKTTESRESNTTENEESTARLAVDSWGLFGLKLRSCSGCLCPGFRLSTSPFRVGASVPLFCLLVACGAGPGSSTGL